MYIFQEHTLKSLTLLNLLIILLNSLVEVALPVLLDFHQATVSWRDSCAEA